VSYSDEDPSRAQRVTNRLATVFVEESSKTREQRAEHTSTFIASQLAASQARLADLQARLRRAKESHIGQLPEQTGANLSMLSGLRQQLDTNSNSLRGEQDRLSMIERQLETLSRGGNDIIIIPRAGATASEAATTPESRAMALERELATARLTYTDKHPEVVRLQGELATARAEATADQDRPAAARTARLQNDPAYRQLVADREMARLRIRELSRAEPITAGRLAAFNRASKRRRWSNSSSRRCSAITTSRSSSTRSSRPRCTPRKWRRASNGIGAASSSASSIPRPIRPNRSGRCRSASC
jgi:uncharacterized protein involved in exopolysaccharide biosynthesis